MDDNRITENQKASGHPAPEQAANGQTTSGPARTGASGAGQTTAARRGPEWPGKFRPLPHEDEAPFAAFERLLLKDLDANTGYEHDLARTIIRLRQEAKRLWGMRETLLQAWIRSEAQRVLHAHFLGKVTQQDMVETVAGHVAGLFGEDEAQKTASVHVLSQAGTTLEALAAQALVETAETLAMLHHQIANLETRQRRLHEDYMLLKASCTRPVNPGRPA